MFQFLLKNRPNKKKTTEGWSFLCFEDLNRVVVRLVQTFDSLEAVCRDFLSTAIRPIEKISDNNTRPLHIPSAIGDALQKQVLVDICSCFICTMQKKSQRIARKGR